MKIICLVKDSPLMRYYVNRVHEHFGVYKVVKEESSPPDINPSIVSRIVQKTLKGQLVESSRDRLVDILSSNKRRRSEFNSKAQTARSKILGNKSDSFVPGLSFYSCYNINDLKVRNMLAEEQPDVILVQGTSIVKDITLPRNSLCINMHAGLSPYYRGGACTLWALMNWDPYNIGVTLHKLTESSDAGPIIAQKRVIPDESDS